MNDDFLYRDVPALERRVFRLGLANNFGIEGVDLEWALDQGLWSAIMPLIQEPSTTFPPPRQT